MLKLYRYARFTSPSPNSGWFDVGTDGINIYCTSRTIKQAKVYEYDPKRGFQKKLAIEPPISIGYYHPTSNKSFIVSMTRIDNDMYMINLIYDGEVCDKKAVGKLFVLNKSNNCPGTIGSITLSNAITEYYIDTANLIQQRSHVFGEVLSFTRKPIFTKTHVYAISNCIEIMDRSTEEFKVIKKTNKPIFVSADRNYLCTSDGDILSVPTFDKITTIPVYVQRKLTNFIEVDGFIVIAHNLQITVYDRSGQTVYHSSHDNFMLMPVGNGKLEKYVFEGKKFRCNLYDFTWDWRNLALQTAEIQKFVIAIILTLKRAAPYLGRNLMQLIVAKIMRNDTV